MTASDYPVTFGYGATDGTYYGPNGSVGKYHRGNDRPCPTGTPIVIGGVTIGLTDTTGAASGPHLHTQAGTDKACQNTFDPSPLEFKSGTVVSLGEGSQWGKFITIKVGSQYITYCHLQRIDVNVGQVLNDNVNPEQLNEYHYWTDVVDPSTEAGNLYQQIADRAPENDKVRQNRKRGDLIKGLALEAGGTIRNLKKENADLKAALGKKSDVDPDSIVITRTGFAGLFDVLKNFFK